MPCSNSCAQNVVADVLRPERGVSPSPSPVSGIAHDFNNLLTAIIGYCELTLRDLPADLPPVLRGNLGEIRKAAMRAAGLTRQLVVSSRLPARPQISPPDSFPEPGAAARSGETVLLVEDEPMLRELGMHVLEELGYRVFLAENGQDALRVLSAHPADHFDLLITDVVMPEMGGRELVEQLRPLSPATKIIFCSGYAEAVIFHGRASGPGVSFLQKPYTVADVAEKVRAALAA